MKNVKDKGIKVIAKKDFREFIETKPKESEISEYLKKDLSVFAEVYAKPQNEYIIIPEYRVGDRKVDYIMFFGRSRMKVRFIEIKGADFDFYDSHKSTYNTRIKDAVEQIDNKVAYFTKNYQEFRVRAHEYREKAEHGLLKGIGIESPKNDGRLFVDPEKDITLFTPIIIGGNSNNDRLESRIRDDFYVGNNRTKKLETWDSFIRQMIRE